MQTFSSHHNNAWASGSNRPNPSVPRSTSVEYEKETQQTALKSRLAPPPSRLNNTTGAGLRSIPAQSTRRPGSKTASVHHVPDSEAEAENDADISGRAKSPLNQIIDVAKRTLAPATFYLRQRSQDPDVSADVSHANGHHSSYDYSAEEREFQANRSKPNSISAQRKNRMSVDNKAYKPTVSDGESSEEYSDDEKGRRRRKKKKKDGAVGGPLTTLPIMPADKKKRRRSRGGRSGTGDEGEDSESDGNTAAEKASNPRASVARSSMAPPSRRSAAPEPLHVGDASLDDTEQGLQSIPEAEVEDEQAQETDEPESPDIIQSHQRMSFSIGAFLGQIVHLTVKTSLNTLVFLVHILSGLFFVIGRILGTIVEIILIRPLRILGLLGSPSFEPKRPAGKYFLIGLALLGAWYAIQEPNNLPLSIPASISIPSLFRGKGKSKHDQAFVVPEDVPANFAELVARLTAIESAVSDLSGDRTNSHDDLLGRLDELADRVSREARERKRVLDSVDGKVRDSVEGAARRIEENVERKVAEGVDRKVQRKVEESVVSRVKEVERKVVDGVVSSELSGMKKEMEMLRAELASSASSKNGANDEEARNKLRVLEERLGEMEGEVKEALELGKKAVVPATSATPSSGSGIPWWTKFSPSKGSLPSDITLKSADGQDITALLDQMITTSVLTHLHKDVLSIPDYALFSAGARVIPSLTSATLELSPRTVSSQLVAFVTGHGYALGRPPVTALHHDVQNGFCWPFPGSEGHLGVQLAAPVKVESVSVDHVPKEVAFDVRSAPREMEVWALVEGEENVTRLKEWREMKASSGEAKEEEEHPYPAMLPRQPEYIRLADFTYDVDGPSYVQNFPVSDEIKDMGLNFGVVVLVVKNNWGRRDFTCLYRFRVHGSRVQPEPALADDGGA
ncbi:hypothetical protein AX14_007095 [Amanita brunnescens Koide BX004]|nr:hypothetical protein AX14_012374 [Amanita brunnescens Koide BX004]KAF8727695.1 hypothetical protein AX14_007095 [Amanita brunnescens Koide BX004]